MPPKAKLHNKKGKLKSFAVQEPSAAPQPVQSTSSADIGVENGAEQIAQFELELCWCIQRLEVSLQDNKINQKQAYDSLKILNVLRSKTQPTVRKRQLMRMHFGDYRAQMAKEEKQSRKLNDQISFSKSADLNEKSTYIRKSFALSNGENSFKFNFRCNEENKEDKIQEAPIQDSTSIPPQISNDEPPKLIFSNDAFKFNFSVDDDKKQ